MTSQIESLKDRVLARKGTRGSKLTGIMDFVRQFSFLGDLLGRTFEVRNPQGELVYVIKQKPIGLGQFNKLMKEFSILRRLDMEREQAMLGGKKGRSGRR